MAQKCVHKGCGKVFTEENEDCIYHPGPPVFHEGQKGWKCCKPRVLTFDEFLTIPPCTTGKHSTIDDTPAAEPHPAAKDNSNTTNQPTNQTEKPELAVPAPAPRLPQSQVAQTQPSTPVPAPESDSDDPAVAIPAGKGCRRRGCGAQYAPGDARGEERCTHHPGVAIFHEGSKGWSCCKRRVLEFDEFMKIEGCMTKERHLFVGSGKKERGDGSEENLESVRHDFYQTPTSVIASMYLKKIDPSASSIRFTETSVDLDLRTSDKKRYAKTVPLFGSVVPDRSSFKIMGTKLELTLVKTDGSSWPVLRADDQHTGEIIQMGRAGRV